MCVCASQTRLLFEEEAWAIHSHTVCVHFDRLTENTRDGEEKRRETGRIEYCMFVSVSYLSPLPAEPIQC